MINRSQKYTISGVLTLLTVATTAGIGRGNPAGVPAQLATPNINVFRETETMNGVTLRKDEHNIVICPANTESRVASEDLERTSIRFWAYQYSGREPQVTGEFYISPGELGMNPHYSSIDTLRRIAGGKRYYVMSAVTLRFTCNEGLTKKAVCGDGYVDRDEQCDDGNDAPNDGCTQCREDFCEDSDASAEFPGGVGNLMTKGTVRGTGGGGGVYTSTDACLNGTTLMEYGCIGTSINSTYERCAAGCRDGACNRGAVCGNGILEGNEGCDVVHEGCNQKSCTAKEGYVCENNACRVYIPTLGGGVEGGGGGVSSGSSQSTQERLEASIIRAENANPDADRSAVPVGVSAVGQFKLTAAAAPNGGQRDRATIDGLIFTVNASNVVVSATDIKFYNKADSTQKRACSALYNEGSPFTASNISGLFLARCEGLRDSPVQTGIDPGASQTFVLELNVLNPALNGTLTSNLQVSLENIKLDANEYGVGNGKSRVRWFSIRHEHEPIRKLRFDVLSSFVKSTLYAS